MDLMNWQEYHIYAKTFVVCGAGTVLTAQILWNSQIGSAALGAYLSEQPMAFCQIVLRQSIVDALPGDARFADRIQEYRKQHPNDPIPIPMNDPDPQLTHSRFDGSPLAHPDSPGRVRIWRTSAEYRIID